jgi:AmpD protein
MRVDVGTGLLVGVKQIFSPHFDARPGVAPDLIVLHGISLPPGEFSGPWIARLFTGAAMPPEHHPFFATLAGLRASAHLLVRRDGGIEQFVSFNDRAWHAGKSSWQGRDACNDYSIGIECEGTDELPYADAQYDTLRTLLPKLSEAYPAITPGRIVGHSDVAPGRKSDPGPSFDWARVRAP